MHRHTNGLLFVLFSQAGWHTCTLMLLPETYPVNNIAWNSLWNTVSFSFTQKKIVIVVPAVNETEKICSLIKKKSGRHHKNTCGKSTPNHCYFPHSNLAFMNVYIFENTPFRISTNTKIENSFAQWYKVWIFLMTFPFPSLTLEVLIETFNNRYRKMTLTSHMSACYLSSSIRVGIFRGH